MHVLFGGPALSPFQNQRISARTGTEFQALEVFLLDMPGSLEELRPRLVQLLCDGAGLQPDGPPCFIVLPRLGTISPWSTKATEILHACGLGAVRGWSGALPSGPVPSRNSLTRCKRSFTTG